MNRIIDKILIKVPANLASKAIPLPQMLFLFAAIIPATLVPCLTKYKTIRLYISKCLILNVENYQSHEYYQKLIRRKKQ